MAATSTRGKRSDELARRYVELFRRREAGEDNVGPELEAVAAELADAIRYFVALEVKRRWRKAGCQCEADGDDLAGWLWWGVWEYLPRYDGRHALSTHLRASCFRAGLTMYLREQLLICLPKAMVDSQAQRDRARSEHRQAAERILNASFVSEPMEWLPARSEGDASRREQTEQARRLVSLLPEQDRRLLLSLRVHGGDRTFAEIGREAGVSKDRIRQRAAAALDRARATLETAGVSAEDVT